MKHCWMFLMGMVLCAKLCAQNYSDEVTLVQADDNTAVVLATAVSEKKKDAATLATKSAFHALFHSGIPDLKNGVPMIAVERKDYDYRFFSESRYINYIGGEVKTMDDEKIAGKYRVTVRVAIKLKSLCADLERNNMAISPGWSNAKAVKATAALNPTIAIVPYTTAATGYSFEAMRRLMESSRLQRHVINRLSQQFQNHGYKTRDIVSQLQNSKNDAVFRMDAQTDEQTQLIQMLPGDIIVTAEIVVNTDANNHSECTLNLEAVEKQTNGKLATAPFASGKFITTDSMRLADYAVQKVSGEFFNNLQAAFEDMIKKGREVFVGINLSQSVTEWDFEQDSPVTGDFFKDALDDWLHEHSYQGVYDMSNSNDKFINIRLNIPLWNMERNRSYTLSNFGSDLRKFFKAQLGDDYKASVTAMGQKLSILIE